MKRKLAAIILLVCFLGMFVAPGYAHDSQDEHDKDICRVLFGSDQPPKGNAKERFDILKDAAALCIDQFSSNDTQHAKEKTVYIPLSEKMKIPFSFDDIDLNSKQNNGKNVTAHDHRSFTHQGWNFKYENREFWDRRKQILLDAVQQAVFSKSDTILSWFPWLNEQVYGVSSYNEQRDAFCALIYYVHILGDHMEGKNEDQLGALLPLSRRDMLRSPGIIPELLEYLQILFPTQKYSYSYLAMQSEMESIAVEAERNYYANTTGIHSNEEIAENTRLANKLLDTLIAYIPRLLSEESFFENAFSE